MDGQVPESREGEREGVGNQSRSLEFNMYKKHF